MLDKTGSLSGSDFILEEPASMLIYTYNTGSWSAGDLYEKNLVTMLLYNTRSWSAGDCLPEKSGQHPVIQHRVLLSRWL